MVVSFAYGALAASYPLIALFYGWNEIVNRLAECWSYVDCVPYIIHVSNCDDVYGNYHV